MIEIRNLSKRFPTGDGEFTALEGINLTITDRDSAILAGTYTDTLTFTATYEAIA